MPNGNDCNIFIRLDFVRPKFYIKSIMHGRIKNGLCVLILSAVLSLEAVAAAQSGGARYTSTITETTTAPGRELPPENL